ncbi:MAG TPA: hypothetical protein VMM93_10645 [Vicinamibacterales bacterium]|nr:hypothetical protein [Vicinamibacterales bacterium]
MTHDAAPHGASPEADLPPGLDHPRGTLAIVIVFGVLFAAGWFAMYFLRFMSTDVPHH